MTDAVLIDEPFADPDDDAPGHGAGGPASASVTVSFGFWVFLLSDIVMFSALFAAHAVLAGHTAGGPYGASAVSSASRGSGNRPAAGQQL